MQGRGALNMRQGKREGGEERMMGFTSRRHRFEAGRSGLEEETVSLSDLTESG
jgi:hypothetical protein